MAFDPVTLGAAVQLAKDPATIKASVEDWLDDHPEATTTVQDGSITKAKLDSNLQSTVDDVTELKSALNQMTPVATSSDIGKALIVESIADGKPKSWRYGEAGGNIISDELKAALLQLASKIAYIDTNGKDYYDDLYDALYPTANLISIAAVFTQGEVTIYNTDSIDSLKQYLLVTAYYDNGTSSVLSANNYTLNGSLAVGSSIITASYNGKTDNFNVVVTDGFLPAGYTKHDYIYNKVRDNNSIIDTKLAPQYNGVGYEHSIEFMMTVNARGAADCLYGLRAYSGSDPRSRALWAKNLSGTNMIAANFGGTDTGFVQNINLNTKYKSVTKNGRWYIDDTLVMDNMDTGSYIEPQGGTIGIFGIYTQTTKGSSIFEGTRIYSFKVVDSSDGSLVADFVPCVNSNNVAGLYDRIRRAFFTAATTSNVEAGDDA